MTDKAAIPALIEKLEKAEGPEREIDVLLWREFGWSEIRDPARNSVTDVLGPDVQVMRVTLAQAIERWPNDMSGLARNWNIPRLTASIDAALSLVERVLPGCLWTASKFSDVLYHARVFNIKRMSPDVNDDDFTAQASTPALAICIAALKAIAQTNDAGETG